jgi:hypothetical protein
VLDPGQYFGEIALVMQNCIRTATVRAMKVCELAELSKKDFDVLMDIYPMQFEQIKIIMEDRLRAYAQRKADDAEKPLAKQRRAGAVEAQPNSPAAANEPPGKRRSLLMAADASFALRIPAADGESTVTTDQALPAGGGVQPHVLTNTAAPLPEDADVAPLGPSVRHRTIAERRGSNVANAPLLEALWEPESPGPYTKMERIKQVAEAEVLQRRHSRAKSISVAPEEFGLGPLRRP